MADKKTVSPDARILSRLVNAKQTNLSPEAARAILQLEFAQEDRDRIHALSLKAQDGTLLPDE